MREVIVFNKRENMDAYLRKYSSGALNAIVSLIGIVAILISILYSGLTQTIWLSVGCSIFASAVIMYLSSHYMLRMKRSNDLIDKWGFEAIYKTRAEMNEFANKQLANCSTKIEIIAFGLKSMREAKGDYIASLAKNGVKIKIISPSINSTFLSVRDQMENNQDGSIKKSIEDLIKWIQEVNTSIEIEENKIEHKVYDFLPLDFYFRIDNSVFVGPYMHGMSSQLSLSMEFCEGEGLIHWSTYFDKIWKLARKVQTDEKGN